ncbi:M15 family metallopeptidase [Paraliobacillus salinarum]|uniref:M15 family metallopeptidase n=1 Tax=Paraliobacillus salinarum TaxID=1158996 RepID=UPI0015F772A7|nr:M15 family metallopeptidase [Paraliobacillus salinarum]
MKKFFIVFACLIGLFLTACQQEDNQQAEDHANKQQEADQPTKDELDDSKNNKEEETNKHIAKIEEETGLHVVDNPESELVYVNKQRKLPTGYVPPNLTVPDVPHFSKEGNPKRQLQKSAADALEELFAEAQNNGIGLVAVSGYRSYERQESIYSSIVDTKGQDHADKYSAKPGTSEHQTGLTMDVASATETVSTLLEESFSQTDAGGWLAEHAHEFGFIIRYPKGKEDITGYSYEPWHIRYVGHEVAQTIYQKDITLEEYFGYDYE